jgi:hypothetical protein
MAMNEKIIAVIVPRALWQYLDTGKNIFEKKF